MTTPAELYETHRELLDRAIEAAAARDYWSAFPSRRASPSTARTPRPPASGRSGPARQADFPIEVPGATGTVATERSPYGLDARRPLSQGRPARPGRRRPRRHPGLARRRPAGPRRRRRRDPAPDQRAHLRAGPRRAAHHRPGVRDGVPGRRRRTRRTARLEAVAVRAGRSPPGMPGQRRLDQAAARRRPAAPGQDQHRGRPRRRPGDRLHHLPHLEQLSRPVRQPGHRQPGDRQAAPRRGPAAGHHRADRPRGAGRGRARPRPGHARRRGAAATASPPPWPPTPTCGSSTSPGPASSATGWRPTPARPSSTPRSPASTRSSSTPPTTTRACCATWPSRCRSTAARCAPPRRTCWSRATASRPTPGHRSAEEFGADLAAALDKLLGDPKRAAGTLGAIVNDGVLARLTEAGGSAGRGPPVRRGRRRAVSRTPRSAPRWWSGWTRPTRRSTPASGSARSRS